MSLNNILYICNAKLQNVVIMSDTSGKNDLESLPKFKQNQLLFNRRADNFKKDSVLINEKIHSDCIIIVDQYGNNVLKNRDEISNKNSDENNLFIEVLKQVHVDKEPANIEEFLLKKRESLQSKLKTATYYFNIKSFVKACDLYKEVLTIIDTDMYPDEFMLKDTDILAIKFGYALSKMAICKADELQAAANILSLLKTEHGDEFPTLYYYLARCLFLLEKYEEAKDVLVCVQNHLKNIEFLSELNWPGSDTKMIVRTEKSLLEENIQTLFKECNEYRLPDIKCIFSQCENKNIFFDSPCFNGYVTVKCSNKCNFTYHRNCWKMKLKVDCVKKPSYFLGNNCATEDCGGTISEILIYDENLHLNTFIVPKVVSNEKHEEKNIPSREKSTKNPLTFNQSANEVPTIISDFLNSIENKTSTPKKNASSEKSTIESASKKEKKAVFNLNAKEYVPVKKETLKLSTSAKEYVPSKISAKYNHAESENRENLFDIISSPECSNVSLEPEPTNATYNYCLSSGNELNIKYSEEDNVSIDFVSDDSLDITKLSTELGYLQTQLFQSEEDYNNLLAQNNLLQEKLQDSLAKSKKCDNCTKLHSVIGKKESEKSAASKKVKELEKTNSELTSKVKELENALSAEVQEKQSKKEHNENLLRKNEILQAKVDDLLSKMRVLSQQHAYMVQHDNINLRKVMFDQFSCIRHAYASYFTLYENKSKHMLWELEDIKSLSSPETLPTIKEIEENMAAWRDALDNSVKSRYMMNGFYDHLFRQFSHEQPNGNPVPTPMSFPSFIVEPPNIIIRHFKSLVIVNKRLEQELHQQMNAFYKMMSTPYPGVFPQKDPPTTSERNGIEIVQSSAVLQNNTSENISEPIPCYSNSKNPSLETLVAYNPKWDSASVTTMPSMPNMYDTLVKASPAVGPASRKITKQSIFKDTDDDVNSRKENYLSDSVSIGTIPKNKTPPMQTAAKSKPDVIGPESLINKLHEKLPLVPVHLISRAVNILRERSKGLTGKDSKQIITEIKQILKEIAITEKCVRKSKELPPEKPAKTWKTVNSGVHWNNDDPDVNCTICFEFMEPDKRMKLRCQHIFHTTCIKLWLQNDSICPICRSFATLDDEYPPLK